MYYYELFRDLNDNIILSSG